MIYGYDIVADFENKRQLENLKEQLEKLKEENKEIKNFHINLVGVNDCEIRELARYKQAIEKIKELIQNEINDCEHCEDCESCEYNCCTKQILQKISEVEDGI